VAVLCHRRASVGIERHSLAPWWKWWGASW
jgi:hypothetical protein